MPSQNIFCIVSRRLAIHMRCFYMPRPAMINTGRKQTGASLSAGRQHRITDKTSGAPHEEARAKRLAEGFDYVDVLPRMSTEEVARVLAGAKFVVSVDTGLSHLTAALDRPNITLYGPTDWVNWRLWEEPNGMLLTRTEHGEFRCHKRIWKDSLKRLCLIPNLLWRKDANHIINVK